MEVTDRKVVREIAEGANPVPTGSGAEIADELSGLISSGKVTTDEPHLLTNAAFERRKLFLSHAHAKGEKEFRRMKLVVSWPVLKEHPQFKGREANPMDILELEAYVAAALAALPPEAGEHQFARDANRIVNAVRDLTDRLRKEFDGRTGVTADEVIGKIALIRLETDRRQNAEVDGPVMSCANEACGFRFVPIRWQFTVKADEGDKIIITGHYLARDGKALAYCADCRHNTPSFVGDDGKTRKVWFFDLEEAEQRADGQLRGAEYAERQADRERGRGEREKKRRAGMADVAKSIFVPKTPRGMSHEQYEERKARGRRD